MMIQFAEDCQNKNELTKYKTPTCDIIEKIKPETLGHNISSNGKTKKIVSRIEKLLHFLYHGSRTINTVIPFEGTGKVSASGNME